jgi:hypothetical protein
MAADVEMEKAAVVDSDSASEEGWDLQSEFVHLLERKAKDGDVGGDALSVFAIGDAADLLVVRRATVAIVNDDFFAGEGAELLERLDEAAFDFQLTAAMAGQFGFREVLAQIAHVRASVSGEFRLRQESANLLLIRREDSHRGCDLDHFEIVRFLQWSLVEAERDVDVDFDGDGLAIFFAGLELPSADAFDCLLVEAQTERALNL